MKKKYVIDSQDGDLTPAIYQLLFSEVLCEIRGNDLSYDIYPWDGCQHYAAKELWDKRNARGCNNCFGGVGGDKAMYEFVKNPCTVEQAYDEFLAYLKKHKIKAGSDVMVKIWW